MVPRDDATRYDNYNYDYYRLRVSQSCLATAALSLQLLYWFVRDHVQYAVRVRLEIRQFRGLRGAFVVLLCSSIRDARADVAVPTTPTTTNIMPKSCCDDDSRKLHSLASIYVAPMSEIMPTSSSKAAMVRRLWTNWMRYEIHAFRWSNVSLQFPINLLPFSVTN